jgi:hypothetical protein
VWILVASFLFFVFVLSVTAVLMQSTFTKLVSFVDNSVN